MSEPPDPAPVRPASEETAPPPVGRRPDNGRGPGRLRRWLVRPFVWGLALLLLLLVGAYFLLISQLGRSRVAALVIARTSQFLGRPVQVGGIDYTFFPLAVELEDVVIPGPRPGDPAVATVPLVRIQSSWRDLRQKVLLLEQIDIVEPRVYLQFNPDGTSNLPEFRTGRGGRGRFETRIGRILVQDGELRINHRRLPLELDARAVWARFLGTSDRTRLAALLTAQEVVTTLPDARPYPFTLSAKGSLLTRAGEVRLASVRLASPDLRARGSGVVGWRGGTRVELAVAGEGEMRLFNRLGYMDEPIEGPFGVVDGRFHMAREEWSYGGEVTSPRIAVLDRVVRDVSARLAGGPEELRAEVRRALYAGGRVEGDVLVDTDVPEAEKEAGVPVTLDLAYRDLALETLLADQEIPVSGLTGRVSGTLVYELRASAPLEGSGRADVRLSARERTAGLALSGTAPITIRNGVFASDAIRLAAPGQRLAASGSLDLEPFGGTLDYRLDTEDLGPLVRLVPVEGPAPSWLPTAGQGRAEGTLRFTPDVFTTEVTLALQDVAAPAFAVDQVAGSFRFSPGAVDALDLAARRGAGTLAVRGRIPLPVDGRIAPAERLALDLDAARWPAAALAGLIPGAPQTTGEVSGTVRLGGTFESLAGRADLRVASLAVEGNSIGEVEAAVAFDGPRIEVEQGVVRMPAGELLVTGSLDRATEEIRLTADAPSLALDREPLRRYLRGTSGQATLAATVDGTLSRPQATVTLRGSDLALSGRPLGQAGDANVLATWDGATVRAAGSLLGLVHFDGGGRLDRRGAEVTFALRSDSLAGLARVAAQRAMPDFTGSLNGTLAATADFSAGAYRAELTLDRLAAQFSGREIANLEPIVVSLTPERLEIASFYLGEPEHDTELFVNGSVGLGGTMPLDLRILSTVWVGWLQLALPDYSFSGFFDVLATVRGTVDAPLLNGEGVLRDARVILPDLPHALEDMTGVVYFDRASVVIDNVRAKIGGGTLVVFGNLDLPVAGAPFRYQVQANAQDLSLRYPEGWLVRGDAQVSVHGTAASRQVRGNVELERAFYLEDVELGTLQLLQQVLRRERLEVLSTDDTLAATELFLTVRGDNALRVRNNVANLTGDIDLVVRGTAARPVVFGRVELEPGGKLTYADNEYELERGLLTFDNPYRLDPVIDLAAKTEIRNFEISLTLSGTLERLDANFSSNANQSDLEILALLATGQELGTAGERELFAPGQGGGQDPTLGAGGFLASQAASVLSKRVGTLFGFDRFRINPIAGETGEAVGAVGITVGKRLSRNVFVTYSTNPSTTRQNVLQVEWQVAKNLTLILTQSTEQEVYSVDAQWERRF